MADLMTVAVGDTVTVADLAVDTGVVDGVEVSTLSNPGVVQAVSLHPPGVPADSPNDPSPHALVRLGDKDVWFAQARLTKG